jgi:predicted RNase H-like HicB family nuclease
MEVFYEALLIPEDEGGYSVYFPDWKRATCGDTIEEASSMALDLLKTEVSYALANNEALPVATFGNTLKEATSSMIVATVASTSDAKKRWSWITTSQAADMLGVTPGRIHQLIKAGTLDSRKDAHDVFVLRSDVENRSKTPHHPGRPRKQELTTA